MGNLIQISKETKDLLKKNLPLSFYIEKSKNGDDAYNNYQAFATSDAVGTYKKNLLSTIPFGKVQDDNLDRFQFIKIPLTILATVEKEMIKDLKSEDKNFPSIKVPNYKSIKDLDELKSIADNYMINFNNGFSKFYYGIESKWNPEMDDEQIKSQELKSLSEQILDYIKKGKYNQYDIFLEVMYYVSKNGGFASWGSYIEGTDIAGKCLRDIKYANLLMEEGKLVQNVSVEDIPNIQENLKKFMTFKMDTKELKLDFKIDIEDTKTDKKQITVNLENELEELKKQFDEYVKSFYPFNKYIVPVFKRKMREKLPDKIRKNETIIEIMNNEDNWRKYHRDLVDSGYKITEVTFVSSNINKNNNLFTKYTFKGDFGEYLTIVTNKNKNLNVLGLGAHSSNKAIMGETQPGTDEVLTVNGKRYGIQDKEYSIGYHHGVELRLYAERNLTEKLSLAGGMMLLKSEHLKILTSLIELYINSSDDDYINRVLRFADIGQLRAAMYEGMSDKVFSELQETDIVYNPIYKISGVFIPSSCLLAKRYCDILEQSKLTKPKGNDIFSRDFYKIKDINIEKRNDVLRRNGRNRINTLEYLHDQKEIDDILKQVTISSLLDSIS